MKSQTIPRLELVSGHMVVNVSTNVRVTLEGFSMTEDIVTGNLLIFLVFVWKIFIR